jgi:hypothetical protein
MMRKGGRGGRICILDFPFLSGGVMRMRASFRNENHFRIGSVRISCFGWDL